MPADAAAPIYAAELGKSYVPADLPRLYAASQLLEQYFDSATAKDRAAVELKLAALRLETPLLGRLCRIRLGWQELSPGVYYINEKSGPFAVKYFLGIPKGYRRSAKWPLVVKLPTANAFVTTPPPGPDDVVHIYTNWINQELSAHPDALVLMPLLNLSELYGPSYQGMNSVFLPILNAAGKANVDPARVYVMGHSMAAHAVWNIALHYPTYLAAFCAMAGGADADWQRVRVVNLRNVLPVVWADTSDTIVPSRESGEIVSALRKFKINVDYEQTDGMGHLPSAAMVQHLYEEMRSRVRELYPKRVSLQSDRPDTIFNRSDWVQVYQEFDSGSDRVVRIQHGTGTIDLNQNAFSLDATLAGNTVNITAKNVEFLRLYFNDQMVDLNKPIEVIVNDRPRFSGIVAPSLDEMLKDQLFLGRGWRYYTAVLDLDLGADVPAAAGAGDGGSTAAQPATPATRPHGHITIYNPDGSIQRIIGGP